MSAIRVDQNILNQRGTPAFFADDFSRRPAAGYQGRIFISADTHEIYRDDTTAWVLIADAGAGSGTLQSVTANGNTTSYGIDILGVGLRVQAGGITDYTIPSGGIMFGSPSYLLTTDTTNLFWDDTNNRLGLGTNTPGARLDIHATGTNATFNGTGTSNSTLVFQRSGTSRWTIGNYYSSAVADDFNIYDNVNSQYRFYVHNTGVINIPTSLIIGSSTPTSSYILDVTGNSNVTGTFRTTGSITSLSDFYLTGSTAKVIGGDSVGRLVLANSTQTTYGIFYGATNATPNITTFINNSALTLTLNANNTATFSGALSGTSATFYSASGTIMNIYSDNATTDNILLVRGNSGSNIGLAVKGSSNVGIGTSSPDASDWNASARLLHIYQNSTNGSVLKLESSNAAGVVSVGNDAMQLGTTTNDPLLFYTNLTEKFSISATGILKSLATYNNTTGVAANVQIDSNGFLARSTVSSLRYKENIKEWEGNGLETILLLKPKTFNYKKDYYDKADIEFLGLIAEEVAEISHYLADYENEDRTGQVENVRYANIVVPLIKAIQELNEKLVRNNIN